MRVAGFHAYARAQCDEMPLYLFDKHFVRSAPALAADYTPPAIFGEDLFALLSPEHRPDYRCGQGAGGRGGEGAGGGGGEGRFKGTQLMCVP